MDKVRALEYPQQVLLEKIDDIDFGYLISSGEYLDEDYSKYAEGQKETREYLLYAVEQLEEVKKNV